MPIRRVKNNVKIAVTTLSTKNLRAKTEFRDVLPPAVQPSKHSDPLEIISIESSEEDTLSSAEQQSSYATKQKSVLDEWVQIRQQLLDTYIEMQAPSVWICSHCGETLPSDPIRCLDCGPIQTFYCEDCEKILHEHLLHKPEIWKVIR